MRKSSILAAFALTIPAVLSSPPAAAACPDCFKGKTITVVVPSGSGGTFHVYGQLVQRHLGRHIPGNPKMILQNRPGAGGAKAASFMMNAAPQDGTVIAEMAPGTLTDPMMRKVNFDATKFQYLGSIAARTYTFAVWHTVPVKTIQEAMQVPVTIGNTGKASAGYTFPTFANHALGTKFKVISGYKGGGEINLAIERGEVQGRANFYSGYTGVRPEWISGKKIRILLVLGPKRPEVEGIPHIRDLLKTQEDREMYEMLEVNLNIGQAFYVPPRVSRDRADALRTAFEAMVKDPALLADAKKRGVPITPRSADEIGQLIERVKAIPKTSAERLAKIIGFQN